MGGINQTLKEKILVGYPDQPEVELAILALELSEKYSDDRDIIKQRLEEQIKKMAKSGYSKGEKT